MSDTYTTDGDKIIWGDATLGFYGACEALNRLTRELAEAKATIAAMQKHGVVMRVTPTDATSDTPDYAIGTFIDNKGDRQ